MLFSEINFHILSTYAEIRPQPINKERETDGEKYSSFDSLCLIAGSWSRDLRKSGKPFFFFCKIYLSIRENIVFLRAVKYKEIGYFEDLMLFSN